MNARPQVIVRPHFQCFRFARQIRRQVRHRIRQRIISVKIRSRRCVKRGPRMVPGQSLNIDGRTVYQRGRSCIYIYRNQTGTLGPTPQCGIEPSKSQRHNFAESRVADHGHVARYGINVK